VPGISAHVTWRVVGNQATHVVAYAPPTASLRGRAPPAAAVPNRQNVTVPFVWVRFSAARLADRNESSRLRNKVLTIKHLQLLRAIIYNEIVKLPDDWKDNVRSHHTLVTIVTV